MPNHSYIESVIRATLEVAAKEADVIIEATDTIRPYGFDIKRDQFLHGQWASAKGIADNIRSIDPSTIEVPSPWVLINDAPLAVWGYVWSPVLRRPFPGMRNGPNGDVWVDTCEIAAMGYQTIATHWMPLPPLPEGE